MSEVLQIVDGVSTSSDRRRHARQRLRSLVYAELDRANGGIVLDASESGISVHAVVPVTDIVLPQFRLKLPGSVAWLETRARVVWTLDSGKVAGLQFEDLPNTARDKIREWLSSEALTSEIDGHYPSTPAEQLLSKDPEPGQPPASQPEIAGLNATPPNGGSPTPLVPAIEPALPREAASHPRLIELDGTPPASEAVTHGAHSAAALAKTLTKPSPEKKAPQINVASPAHRNPAPIYLLLVLLALISLTSGWAAGRGKFGPVVSNVQKFFVRTGAANPRSTVVDGQRLPTVKDFEVIDSENQRRTISLVSGPKQIAVMAPSIANPSDGAAENEKKPGMGFQLWTLAPPKRSAAAGNSADLVNGAPPAVDAQSAAPVVAPIPSGVIEPPSSDTLPKPANVTGVLKRGVLIRRVEPEYPEFARQQNVAGTVTLQATVGADGRVRSVRVISGPKLLVQAAVNAVRQWRYSPTLLDGKAIETEVEISLVFHLPNGD
jgi:TonB family protein